VHCTKKKKAPSSLITKKCSRLNHKPNKLYWKKCRAVERTIKYYTILLKQVGLGNKILRDCTNNFDKLKNVCRRYKLFESELCISVSEAKMAKEIK